MKRLHDLDALRACAMLLGVLLHAVFYTIPFRYFRHHVLPGASNAWALPYFHLVQLVHGFRMPVFFLLSGFFCALLWQRRGLRGLLKNRILRIALPLLICIPTVRSMEYSSTCSIGATTQQAPSGRLPWSGTSAICGSSGSCCCSAASC